MFLLIYKLLHPFFDIKKSINFFFVCFFSFKAQNPDELTIVENEQLEVVGEGDGKN